MREIPYFSVPKSAALNFQASVTCKQALGGGEEEIAFSFPSLPPLPEKQLSSRVEGRSLNQNFTKFRITCIYISHLIWNRIKSMYAMIDVTGIMIF